MGDAQIAHRFAGHIALVEHFNAGAHLLKHIQDAGAARVEPHVFHREVGPGGDRAGDQPERGGTDIAGHHHRLAPQA